MEGCCFQVKNVLKLLGLAACVTVVSTAGAAQSVKNSAPSQKGAAVQKSAQADGALELKNTRNPAELTKGQPTKGQPQAAQAKAPDKGSPWQKPASATNPGLGKIAGDQGIERGGADGTNDCATGSNIAGAGTFPYSTVGATTDGLGHGLCLSFGSNQLFNDVWFNWTSVAGGNVTIQTCGSSGDSRLAAYNNVACPPGDADLLACNDDFCGLLSQIQFTATAGVTYKIRVGNFGVAGASSGSMSITESGGGGGGGNNDNCADATAISDGTFPFDTTGATTDGPDEPALCFAFGDSQVGSDIWFDYTATCTGLGTVSLCGSGFDTKVAIYDGNVCPTVSSAVACNDDFCALQSQVSFATVAGNHYLIRVGGYNGATGSGTMTVSCLGGGAPANDSCADASLIACGGTASGDTTFATTDGADPNFDCAFGGPQQGGNSVWYRFVATGNTATAALCGSGFDTMVQILDGSCGAFVSLACNDDSCGGTLQSQATAAGLTPGNTYYIEIAGWNGASGSYNLSLSCQDVGPCNGTAENEPDCGGGGAGGAGVDTVNGGCNSSPPVFSPITCGQTYCSSAGANGSFRDTDWYAVTVTGGTEFTWTVNGSFDTLAGIVNNGGVADCAGVSAFLVFATGAAFSDVTVSACVPAGTWWMFAAPSVFGGVACESPYTATLTCAPCDAGAPPNDTCNTAIALSVPSSILGTTDFATADPGLPACGTSISAPGVWYTVVGDGTTLSAATCNPGTFYDTKLHVFCGSCATGQWVCLAGDDDFCGFPPGHSTVFWCTNPGQVYYILVNGFGGGTGDFELSVTSDGVNCGGGVSCTTDGPANDLCENAQAIACGDTINANNQFATSSPSDPNFDCSFGGPQPGVGSIWFTFVATANSASLDLCASSASDTMVQILSGTCAEGFTSLACNDDACGLLSQVTATGLTIGTTYYIEVAGFDAAGTGPITMSLTCTQIEPCVGTPENEPDCGGGGPGGAGVDTVNGGCNSVPPVFSPITCGQTYCSTAGANGSFRDTDWYEVTVGSGTEFTWTGNASFPLLLGIVDNGGVANCAGVSAFLVFTTVPAFTEGSVTACVAPGTWWMFAAPSVFGGVNCPAEYTATLTCVPCSVEVPVNDNCTGAIALSVPSSVIGDTTFASPDPGLPFCGTSISADGIWYTVVGNGSTYTVSTCNPGTAYDTKLNVFCGDCAAGQWVCIGGDDDFCGFPPGFSQVSWCTNPGQTYYILVQGFGGGTGVFELSVATDGVNCGGGLDCGTSGAPNDSCANAQAITCGSTVEGNTQFATVDPTDPNFDCSFGGPQQGFGTIWYTFVATQTSATVTLCGSVSPDTLLQVLDGTCGNFVAVACNDDFCGLQSELVANGLVVGNTYYIEVAAWDPGSVGPITLSLSCAGACVVACPEGGVTEPEACDVDQFSGCNDPVGFIPVACEDTICGTAWAQGGTRDTDWYQLEIVSPNQRNVTFTVTAEFNVLIGIVENGGIPDCSGVSAFRVFATGTPCVPVSVNSLLTPGSWWLFVAASVFDGVAPCGDTNNYIAAVDCGFGEECQGDADNDGRVGLADLARVVANWGTAGPEGDVTGNGIVGLDDIALIIKWWGCGY